MEVSIYMAVNIFKMANFVILIFSDNIGVYIMMTVDISVLDNIMNVWMEFFLSSSSGIGIGIVLGVVVVVWIVVEVVVVVVVVVVVEVVVAAAVVVTL